MKNTLALAVVAVIAVHSLLSGQAAEPSARIVADAPCKAPPQWALLERQVIDAMNEAVEPLLEKYLREDGTILWPTREDFRSIDGLDDAYESFHNWPLFYLLGGDEKFLRLSHREFDVITEQFTRYGTGRGYPMIVREYQPAYDWFHQGEGNYLFYMLCMADPDSEKSRARAEKFARFFTGEAPEAPNYDPEHKIIRCAHNGSKGPGFWNFQGDYVWTAWGYGLPFYDVEGIETVRDLKDPDKMKRYAKVCNSRRGSGDAVVNLASTTLATTAYLMTGREEYRDWALDYTDGWIDRMNQNDGILPDNVGLSGEVGEHIEGRWYGANYGWTWPHGWHTIGQAAVIAAENATLLTGEPDYLRLLRSQIEVLASNGIEKGDKLYVPHKYGTPGKVKYKPWHWLDVLRNDDGKERKRGMKPREYVGTARQKDGWFHFMPMHPLYVTHLWNASMDPADAQLYDRLTGHVPDGKFGIPGWYHTKDQAGHDGAWLQYVRGRYPDYPREILSHNLKQCYGRLAFMRRDTKDPKKYGNSYIQRRNPVSVEGLVQLTLGGPMPAYNGGLLMTRVRYFDAAERRPGLPADVATLVSGLAEKSTVIELVNLHPSQPRNLIVQAGSCAQHRFSTVKYTVRDGRRTRTETAEVDGPHLHVQLLPHSQVRLELGTELFVRQPTYHLPWSDAF